MCRSTYVLLTPLLRALLDDDGPSSKDRTDASDKDRVRWEEVMGRNGQQRRRKPVCIWVGIEMLLVFPTQTGSIDRSAGARFESRRGVCFSLDRGTPPAGGFSLRARLDATDRGRRSFRPFSKQPNHVGKRPSTSAPAPRFVCLFVCLFCLLGVLFFGFFGGLLGLELQQFYDGPIDRACCVWSLRRSP